jgi:hypothetical protein
MSEYHEYQDGLRELRSKRGPQLVAGLLDALNDLQREVVQQKRELAALTHYQRAHDRWLALESIKADRARLPSSIVIEADFALNASDGFYGLEHTAAGVPFRWTGPSSHFSFNVFVDREAGATLELKFLRCMDFALQKELVLAIDAQPVPVQVVAKGKGMDVLAALPPRSEKRVTVISVFVDTVAPESAADERLLGLAFERLSVVSRPPARVPVAIGKGESRIVPLEQLIHQNDDLGDAGSDLILAARS